MTARRRRSGRATTAGRSNGPSWPELLPLDLAQLILAQGLTRDDLSRLALACRATHAWVQSQRTSLRVQVAAGADLTAAVATLAKAPALLTLRLLRRGGLPYGASLLTLSLRCLRLPQVRRWRRAPV